jgi:hypothetical protein
MPGSYDVHLIAIIDNNTAIRVRGDHCHVTDIHVGDTVTMRYLQSVSIGSVVVKAVIKRRSSWLDLSLFGHIR